MEQQLISIIIAGVAVLGISVKILRDELVRKKDRNGHNPSIASIDKKIDGLKRQLYDLSKELALFMRDSANYRERMLEHATRIRDGIERKNP